MHVRVPKLVLNYSGQKLSTHHSNLRTSLDLKKSAGFDCSCLDQVTILDFQLGPDLNDEQFFEATLFLTWKPYLQFAVVVFNQ